MASDIRSSVIVGGVHGSLADCSTDGEVGCRVLGPTLAAANLSGASPKIVIGQTLAGIAGSVAPDPAPCAADNAINCVASTAFPAVVKANVTAGLIKAGTTIAGVSGAYPSSTYPLAGSTGTVDLTQFQSQLTTDGAFEFFDSKGARLTGSGDSDLIATNIRSTVAIESLSLSGTMPAVLPAAPTSLTAMFFATPDRMNLNWTTAGATGYMLVVRTRAAVDFTPTLSQIYSSGVQGSNTILYVGSDLTDTQNGISSGNSYNYAVYSYDANHFYSAVPVRAINSSIFCQGLAGGSWIAVPGDVTYGTNDFCVQKFEAKNVGNVPTSQAALVPWVNISQTSSLAACQALGANYGLISNAEWLTIVTNIAGVASNWSLSAIGAGTINRGHTDYNPSSFCPASTDDSLAWVQGDCTPLNSSGDAWIQKRTHSLSNGAVIWDFSGNVMEMTSYVISNNNAKPFNSANGAPGNFYSDVNSLNSSLNVMTRKDLAPINANKTFWKDVWASGAYGLGQYYSGTNGYGGALIRSGSFAHHGGAGILFADISQPASFPDGISGLRCSAHLSAP